MTPVDPLDHEIALLLIQLMALGLVIWVLFLLTKLWSGFIRERRRRAARSEACREFIRKHFFD